MKISEASAICGLKIDTIRYYDSAGLIPKLERGSDGQRRFSSENVEWLTLLFWLRETGMPMERMREFAKLYAEGGPTIAERKAILLEHADVIERRRHSLDRCETVLKRKIEIYDALEQT